MTIPKFCVDYVKVYLIRKNSLLIFSKKVLFKTNIRGDCLNRGLGEFADLRGEGVGKKEGVVFLRGKCPNAHCGKLS